MEQATLNLFEERQVVSVSQLVNDIRFDLEMQFRNLWVQGEVSNLKSYPSGHLYFTLKDREAQISAVCFRLQAQSLRFTPEDGMDVVVRGSVSVYPSRGQLQLVVETVEPLGRGSLQVAFEQLKARLQAEGLFDAKHKKPLPIFPSKIGVVTSPKGAAIQDILRVLKRRNPRLNVLLYPASVQGSGASREIALGVEYLDRREDVDVIIVGRGGGSLEDLWAFNEEVVARAMFRARKPIISAVGHEIDFTISDFVADIRAATPSAAAELVAEAQVQLRAAVVSLIRRAGQAVRLIVQGKRQKFQRLSGSRAFIDAESRLKIYSQRLDELWARLASVLPALMTSWAHRWSLGRREVERQMRTLVSGRRTRVEGLVRQLEAFSPLAVLERGYAIVTTEAGEVIRSPQQVTAGECVHVRVANGAFKARKEERGV